MESCHFLQYLISSRNRQDIHLASLVLNNCYVPKVSQHYLSYPLLFTNKANKLILLLPDYFFPLEFYTSTETVADQSDPRS